MSPTVHYTAFGSPGPRICQGRICPILVAAVEWAQLAGTSTTFMGNIELITLLTFSCQKDQYQSRVSLLFSVLLVHAVAKSPMRYAATGERQARMLKMRNL